MLTVVRYADPGFHKHADAAKVLGLMSESNGHERSKIMNTNGRQPCDSPTA